MGCAYAVSVGASYYERAMQELAAARLTPERVFLVSDDGVYREIYLR